MHVVVHKYEGMDGNRVFAASVVQQVPIVVTILVIDEDRAPIHTTLGHMHGHIRHFKTGTARHAGKHTE